MVRPTTTEAQVPSQSPEERLLIRSEATGLHRGGIGISSQRPCRGASNPRIDQWPALLEESDVQFLILDTVHDADLLELFQARPGWAIDSRDGQSVLLVRTDVKPTAERSRSRRWEDVR